MDNTSQNSPKAAHDIARLIELPRIRDPRGNLTFVQNGDGYLPFKVERVYWIYDVPAGEFRGSHSHHEGRELLIAVSGSFNVNLHDGHSETTYTLNRPYQGLFVPPATGARSITSRRAAFAWSSRPCLIPKTTMYVISRHF